jgi:hypothetical protein
MEKTKQIAISKEERDEIRRKEIMQKINGLFHRYMEGHLHLNEILKEIDRVDQKTRTMAKEILLSQWIDALSLNEEGEKFLKRIEALKGREVEEARTKLNHLLSQYRESREKINQELRAQSEEALRREGIYGSAVEPNIAGSQPLGKALGNLDQLYGVKLKAIKEQLRAL